MARVLVASMPWGVILNRSGSAVAGETVTLDGTVYTTEGGSTPVTPIVSDDNGVLPGWVNEGSYTLTHDGGSQRVEAVAGASVVSGAATLGVLGGLVFPAVQLPAPIAAGDAPNNAEFRDLSNRMKRKDNSGNVIGRRVPVSIDLYGPQSQEAFSLVGPTAATYAFPGSALTSSSFEFYAGIDVRVLYAVWHVIWTPTNAAAGIRLVQFDPGPTNIEQISEITGVTGGPRNDSALITSEIQTVINGVDDLTVGVGPHKQVGHQLKGNGSVAAKVYVSRLSIVFEA